MSYLKKLKVLGVVLPVLAIMAFAGASSASAAKTVECKVNESPCSAAQRWPANTEVAVEGTSNLVSGFVNISCATHMVAKNTAESGEPLPGQIVSVEWTGCTSNLGSCSASALNTPWSGTIAATGGGNGTLTVNKPKGKFTCAGTTCEYEASSATATLEGGNPFKVKATNISLTKVGGGFLCSGTATWSGTFTGIASYNGKSYPTNTWVENI
jgi:hypothetical protein